MPGAVVADVAVVIPVHADLAALRTLLERIQSWPERPTEIVVVASARESGLESLCRAHGCALHVCAANRGLQLDHGAQSSRAAALWFLHADTAPPAAGIELVAAAIADGAIGGCFRFGFQGPLGWHKRLLAWLVAVRVRFGGIPYGDQGLFAERSAYLAAGGFAHQPLFEEARLVRRLRRRGEFRTLAAPILVSTRRWDRDGWLCRTLMNRWLALCYLAGVSPERLSSIYHKRMEPTIRTHS